MLEGEGHEKQWLRKGTCGFLIYPPDKKINYFITEQITFVLVINFRFRFRNGLSTEHYFLIRFSSCPGIFFSNMFSPISIFIFLMCIV